MFPTRVRPCQTKDHKILECGRVKRKTIKYMYLLLSFWSNSIKEEDQRIMITFPSGATCLPVDCFIIELALYKCPAKHAGLIHWGHIYRHIDVHAMIHQLKCSIGVKQQYSLEMKLILVRYSWNIAHNNDPVFHLWQLRLPLVMFLE